MNPFRLLRIMNRFALVFAAFNLLFALAGYPGGGIPAFLGISAAAWFAAGLRRGLKPLVLVLPALILAWAGAWPVPQLVYLGLVTAYALYISLQGLGASLEAATDDFNAGIVISSVLLGLALVSFNLAAFERSAAPFILVYLVSSVVILRAAREMATNGRTSALGRLISVGLVMTATVLCSPPVRRIVLDGLKAGYTFLLGMVMRLLRWFLLAVGAVLAVLIEILTAIARQKGIRMPPSEQTPLLQELEKLQGRGVLAQFLNSRYPALFGQILLLALAVYILVRVFRRHRAAAAAGQNGFIETRDAIPRDGKTWRAKFPTLRRRPADPAQAVRFYYGLFLRLCARKDVKIRPSDTSADINDKARAVFAQGTLEKLRRIYVEVRYGGLPAGDETAREAAHCYRNLKGQRGS